MNRQSYRYYKANTGNAWTFVSNGIYGPITKTVLITKIIPHHLNSGQKQVYNLAFGDLKRVNDAWIIDDSARTNNGDMPQLMATVTQIAFEFMSETETAILSFGGYMDEKSIVLGRNQRNTLYQRIIDSNWQNFATHFNIQGINGDETETYSPGKQYELILFTHK